MLFPIRGKLTLIRKIVIDKCIYKVYTINRWEMTNMEARLQKWGNSDAIRIPSSFIKSLNLKTNDKLDINYDNDKIIITKPKTNKISLKERFDKYNGENLSKEFTWDDAKGKEIW